MGLTEARVSELQRELNELLGPELSQIINAMAPGAEASPFLQIPTGDDIDLSPEDLARLVARSSNAYVRAARLNGIARAELKLAEGAYKKKLKSSHGVGRNKDEREKNAIESAATEYQAFVTVEALVEVSQAMENAARIASESARKLLDKSANMQMGERREERGMH